LVVRIHITPCGRDDIGKKPVGETVEWENRPTLRTLTTTSLAWNRLGDRGLAAELRRDEEQ
jgi:hypothetical protein